MDVFINNWDRFPCDVWQHAGNGTNVLITDDDLVAIDQIVCCISDTRYSTRVTDYCRGIIEYSRYEAIARVLDACDKRIPPLSPLLPVLEFIKRYTGCVPSIQNHRDLIVGARSGIVALSKLTDNDIYNLVDKVKNLVKSDWEHVWAKGMAAIKPEFLIRNLALYRKAVSEMQEFGALTMKDVMVVQRNLAPNPPPPVRVALVQSRTDGGVDTVTLLKNVLERDYGAVRPTFVILPESSGLQSSIIPDICLLAKQYKCYIVPGCIIELHNNKWYNVCVMISPDGTVIAKYRKRFIIGPQAGVVSPGDNAVVVETAVGRVAFLTNDEVLQMSYLRELNDIGGVVFVFAPSSTRPPSHQLSLTPRSRARGHVISDPDDLDLCMARDMLTPHVDIDSMSEARLLGLSSNLSRLRRVCRATGCTICRVDHSDGMCLTYAVTPHACHVMSSSVATHDDDNVLVVDADIYHWNLLTGMFPLYRNRVYENDNYGTFVDVEHNCERPSSSPPPSPSPYSYGWTTSPDNTAVMHNECVNNDLNVVISCITPISDVMALVGTVDGRVHVMMTIDDVIIRMNTIGVLCGPVTKILYHEHCQYAMNDLECSRMIWKQNGADVTLNGLFVTGVSY